MLLLKAKQRLQATEVGLQHMNKQKQTIGIKRKDCMVVNLKFSSPSCAGMFGRIGQLASSA